MLNKREQSPARQPGHPRANRASGKIAGPALNHLNKSLVPVLVAELGARLSEQLPPGLRQYGDDITGHLVEQMLPQRSPAPTKGTTTLPPDGPSLPLYLRAAPGDFTASVMARITFATAVIDEPDEVPDDSPGTIAGVTPGRDEYDVPAVRDARRTDAPPSRRPTPPPLAPPPLALPLRVRVQAIAVTLGFILLLVATTAYVLARTEPGRLLAVAELFGGIGFLVLAFGRTLMPLISLPLLGSLFALTSGATVLHLAEHRRQRAAEIGESEAA